MQARRINQNTRRGSAAVELAIVIPLMATVVFGSVEVCSFIYNKQTLVAAAYNCAVVAIKPTGTDAQVQAEMTQMLTHRGLDGGAVTTTPSSIENLPRGTQITVLVTVPVAGNSLIALHMYGPTEIQASCVMFKEL